MIEELKRFNDWHLKTKGVNLTDVIDEYLHDQKTKTIYLRDVLEYLGEISGFSYNKLINPKAGRYNDLVRARGYLVKYAQINLGFPCKSVYYKLFGFHRDHATALHHKNTTLYGAELAMYNKLVNFIETHNVIWNERNIIQSDNSTDSSTRTRTVEYQRVEEEIY